MNKEDTLIGAGIFIGLLAIGKEVNKPTAQMTREAAKILAYYFHRDSPEKFMIDMEKMQEKSLSWLKSKRLVKIEEEIRNEQD